MGTMNSIGRSQSCSHFSADEFNFPKSWLTSLNATVPPFWIAAFDVMMPDGTVRRLKKSTKKTKRSEALEKALRLESLAKKEHTADQGTASEAYAILAEAADGQK